MPRTGKGGRRTGTPGTAYQNRTDLQKSSGKIPIQTPPSAEYGQSAALRRSQQAVPMANPQAPTPAGSPSAAPTGPPPVPPGGFGDPLRPTDRPDEHVMSGLPVGPGPGPEALTMNTPTFQASPLHTAVGLLSSLGDSASPQIRALRAQLQATIQNQATHG